MAIRDRGKIKWGSAFFMPEHVKMLKEMRSDYHKQQKPILDTYQVEEIENKIHEAMEFAISVAITVWHDGFFTKYEGMINRLDGIGRYIYLAITDGGGSLERIRFEDIVSIELKGM
ncbi:YolD-like family protein [Pseudoneobacillus sp. C159]